MDRLRLAIAIVLAAIVMIGWPIVLHYIAPEQAPRRPVASQQRTGPPPPAPVASATPAPTGEALASTSAPVETTQVPKREITINSEGSWSYKLSNEGAGATSMRILGERQADGSTLPITGADSQPLELIPQDVHNLVKPLGIRLPWKPELAA